MTCSDFHAQRSIGRESARHLVGGNSRDGTSQQRDEFLVRFDVLVAQRHVRNDDIHGFDRGRIFHLDVQQTVFDGGGEVFELKLRRYCKRLLKVSKRLRRALDDEKILGFVQSHRDIASAEARNAQSGDRIRILTLLVRLRARRLLRRRFDGHPKNLRRFLHDGDSNHTVDARRPRRRVHVDARTRQSEFNHLATANPNAKRRPSSRVRRRPRADILRARPRRVYRDQKPSRRLLHPRYHSRVSPSSSASEQRGRDVIHRRHRIHHHHRLLRARPSSSHRAEHPPPSLESLAIKLAVCLVSVRFKKKLSRDTVRTFARRSRVCV